MKIDKGEEMASISGNPRITSTENGVSSRDKKTKVNVTKTEYDGDNFDIDVDYGELAPEVEEGQQLYWHVFTSLDTQVYGTPEEPMLMTGIIGESPYKEIPEEMMPPGGKPVAVFDHEPTRQELDSLAPEGFTFKD